MYTTLPGLLCFAVVASAGHIDATGPIDPSVLPGWAEQPGKAPPWVRDRILLRLRGEAAASLADRPALEARAGKRVIHSRSLLRDPRGAEGSGLERDLVLELAPGSDLEKELAWWQSQPEVEVAEPDWLVEIQLSPQDPDYSLQWGLHNTGQWPGQGQPGVDINAEAAWELSTGAEWLTIAILDTGIDLDHPDLAAKLVPGIDLVNDDALADDDHDHGTACASLAAALSDNPEGSAGVDWQARLMPVKVMAASGQGSTSDIIDGVWWAMNHGADVISMSLGGGGYTTAFDTVIRLAHDTGTAVFAAAGNDDLGVVNYPARYPEAFAVGALSPCNERKSPTSCDGEWWWGSNYGSDLDLMAPGCKLRSAVVGGYTNSMGGTSGATPHAAGVAGLIKSLNPGLDTGALYQLLRDTAVDMGPQGFDTQTGYGRLDAGAALAAVPEPVGCDLDQEAPRIVHDPLADTAVSDAPYEVACRLLDDCGILLAVLRYRVDEGAALELSLAAGANDWYTAEIPAQPLGSVIDYEILALDSSDFFNESRAEYRFHVTQDAPLAAPLLQIARLPDGGLRLHWDAVAGASQYELLCSTDGDAFLPCQVTAQTELVLPAPAEGFGAFRVTALR